MSHDVTVEEAPERVVRRSIVVNAPATTVFDILANPARHHEFDGSGTVRDAATSAPTRLHAGAKFGMSMRMFVPYRMTNEVIEFEENERIAWRHIGGHVWRYSLTPSDAGTLVTEEFDWRPSKFPLFLRLTKAPASNADAIEKTLPRLRDVAEADHVS